MLNRNQIAHEYMLALMAQDRTNRPLNQFDGSELAYSIADAMIAEAEKRKNMQRPAVVGDEWISVWGSLPEDKQEVLVFDSNIIKISTYRRSTDDFSNTLDVTHWQPLPEPPK